jgi:hypothetical protein
MFMGAPRDIVAPPGPAQDSAPALLQRSDDDFLQATLQQLRSGEGRGALRQSLARATDAAGTRKLFQPVQRQFHVALAELWCATAGTPRVDPRRIASAGLVIRRVRRDAQGRELLEGWMKAGGRLQGWLPITRLGDERAEPRAELRLPQPGVGVAANPSLGRALRRLALEREDALLNEQFTPAFVAPPDVCADANKTLLFAVVPTTSSEIAAVPATPQEAFGDGFGADDPDFVAHLVEPLRGLRMDFVLAGETVLPQWFEAVEAPGAVAPDHLPAAHWNVLKADPGRLGMRRFTLLLRQLASEFDAFGDSAGGQAVFAELQRIRLPLLPRSLADGSVQQRDVAAGDFLKAAYRVLIEQDATGGQPEMPQSWPAASDTDARRLRQQLAAAVRERFVAMKGAPGRYDEPGASYRLRMFVRLKPEPGTEAWCHGHTLWSGYSEPFVIAPWYEGSGAPPVQVALPDPTDRGFLRSLKPNVAFAVPPSLQNLLGGNPKDLMEGKGDTKGLSLGWICGFNIPLITICAFIVLCIFFSLFNLIFWWLPFLKICIPFPKRSGGNG